jgi:hypothetical protein
MIDTPGSVPEGGSAAAVAAGWSEDQVRVINRFRAKLERASEDHPEDPELAMIAVAQHAFRFIVQHWTSHPADIGPFCTGMLQSYFDDRFQLRTEPGSDKVH